MAFIDELRNKSDMHETVEKEVVNEIINEFREYFDSGKFEAYLKRWIDATALKKESAFFQLIFGIIQADVVTHALDVEGKHGKIQKVRDGTAKITKEFIYMISTGKYVKHFLQFCVPKQKAWDSQSRTSKTMKLG